MLRYFLLFVCITIFVQIQAQPDTKLGFPVNIPDAQSIAPVISTDGRTIVFVSNRGGKWGLFESQMNADSSWSQPRSIKAINDFSATEAAISAPSLNADGTILYFSAIFANGLGDADIYVCEKKNNEWGTPQNVGAPINTVGYDGMPSVTWDNRTLYFVRNNTSTENEGYDCKRMFVSYRNDTGVWSEPVPLPTPLNMACESAPRILLDGKMLVFSSVREPIIDANTGQPIEPRAGFDLYYSQMLASNVWSEPKLLNSVGTAFDDGFVSAPAAGNKLYYSFSGKDKKTPFGWIFSIGMPRELTLDNNVTWQGVVTDVLTNKPIDAVIEITEPRTSRVITRFKNNANDGSYFFMLNEGSNYRIDFYRDAYSHVFLTQSALVLDKNETVVKNVGLFPQAKLILNVFDTEIYEPLQATIQVTDVVAGTILPITPETIKQGRFSLQLPVGKRLKITADCKNFEQGSTEFDLTGVVQFGEFERDIELKPQKRELVINISDEQTSQPLSVAVTLVNLDRNETIETKADRNAQGKYVIMLREGDRYEVNVQNPKGYAYYNTTVDLNAKSDNKLDVKLTPLNANTKLTLNDITFETNSDALNASSFFELDRLAKLLSDNPQIKVEISAHTDDVGNETYNLKLSDRRAQSAVSYLLDKNIPIARMIAKGYGETKPIAPNDTDENKARNRRVELKIIEVSDK